MTSRRQNSLNILLASAPSPPDLSDLAPSTLAKLPSKTQSLLKQGSSSLVPHPLLTNFGPESAASFFRNIAEEQEQGDLARRRRDGKKRADLQQADVTNGRDQCHQEQTSPNKATIATDQELIDQHAILDDINGRRQTSRAPKQVLESTNPPRFSTHPAWLPIPAISTPQMHASTFTNVRATFGKGINARSDDKIQDARPSSNSRSGVDINRKHSLRSNSHTINTGVSSSELASALHKDVGRSDQSSRRTRRALARNSARVEQAHEMLVPGLVENLRCSEDEARSLLQHTGNNLNEAATLFLESLHGPSSVADVGGESSQFSSSRNPKRSRSLASNNTIDLDIRSQTSPPPLPTRGTASSFGSEVEASSLNSPTLRRFTDRPSNEFSPNNLHRNSPAKTRRTSRGSNRYSQIIDHDALLSPPDREPQQFLVGTSRNDSLINMREATVGLAEEAMATQPPQISSTSRRRRSGNRPVTFASMHLSQNTQAQMRANFRGERVSSDDYTEVLLNEDLKETENGDSDNTAETEPLQSQSKRDSGLREDDNQKIRADIRASLTELTASGSRIPFNYARLNPMMYRRSPSTQIKLVKNKERVTGPKIADVEIAIETVPGAWPPISNNPAREEEAFASLSHQEAEQSWPETLPVEVYEIICSYLPRRSICNFRCVNHYFADVLASVLFGAVVPHFSRGMFDINNGTWDESAPTGNMFEKFGIDMRKFGISFEVDLPGLYGAQPKIIEDRRKDWWGEYNWPKPVYPRFASIQTQENLADNHNLLKNAFSHLRTNELGLSVDSGHGWLNGPDISDMAIWREKESNGSTVFGKTFTAKDTWDVFALNAYFGFSQMKTLHEILRAVQNTYPVDPARQEIEHLVRVNTRNYESYRVAKTQPDTDARQHVGGTTAHLHQNAQNLPQQFQQQVQQIQQLQAQAQAQAQGHQQPATGAPLAATQNNTPTDTLTGSQQVDQPLTNMLHVASLAQSQHLLPPGSTLNPQAAVFQPCVQPTQPRRGRRGRGRRATDSRSSASTQQTEGERPAHIEPQWPIIFNGYNLAGDVGGHTQAIIEKTGDLRQFPLLPIRLTEPQAQWLMETAWAQKAFLTAYTSAILSNKDNFKNVRSLHIAKLSSGLLGSLEQREFWRSLPGLTNLTLLISPDWRTEHSTGDQNFQANMLISPASAAGKFASFLRQYVSPIEHLSSLKIGYFGGGEHATGICARNQHVLPAPICYNPRAWVDIANVVAPNPNTMLAFNHIKKLCIENAWVSPLMLKGFMLRTRDTSLHHLTLKSVSLTAAHTENTVPVTVADQLDPTFAPNEWLHESLPMVHSWPQVMDDITPGKTFLDRRYDSGMVDPFEHPRPAREYRGNIEKITFDSCGYVTITGFTPQEFCQTELLRPGASSRDAGLDHRERALREQLTPLRPNTGINNHVTPSPNTGVPNPTGIMLREVDSQGQPWPLLGRLTQCVHPVEKRVLEQAWGMVFGWGDDMERWAAVEDGCFEGGTGRFSGMITKADQVVTAVTLAPDTVADGMDIWAGDNSGELRILDQEDADTWEQ